MRKKVIGYSEEGREIVATVISSSVFKPWVLLTSGIHGDEIAGVEFLRRFIDSKKYDNYTKDYNFVIIDCINPDGIFHGKRVNSKGVDLNRDFTLTPASQEVRVVKNYLEELGIDFKITIDFHETLKEDVVDGMSAPDSFYCWEINHNRDKRVGSQVISTLKSYGIKVCDHEKIWGDINSGGVIFYPEGCASVEYSGAASLDVFLHNNYTGISMTTETYTEDLLEDRINTNLIVLDSALKALLDQKK